jgi:hypothetical protein
VVAKKGQTASTTPTATNADGSETKKRGRGRGAAQSNKSVPVLLIAGQPGSATQQSADKGAATGGKGSSKKGAADESSDQKGTAQKKIKVEAGTPGGGDSDGGDDDEDGEDGEDDEDADDVNGGDDSDDDTMDVEDSAAKSPTSPARKKALSDTAVVKKLDASFVAASRADSADGNGDKAGRTISNISNSSGASANSRGSNKPGPKPGQPRRSSAKNKPENTLATLMQEIEQRRVLRLNGPRKVHLGDVFSEEADIARAFHAIRYIVEIQKAAQQGRSDVSGTCVYLHVCSYRLFACMSHTYAYVYSPLLCDCYAMLSLTRRF